MLARRWIAALLVAATAAACAEDPAGPNRPHESSQIESLYRMIPSSVSASVSLPPILVGAGDIARCYDDNPLDVTPPALTAAESTARLLDRIPGTVYTAGDNAYEFGSPYDYATCYHPTWGRHRARTRPSAGNHEYLTPGAAGYFGYFGARAAPPGGYYSYDLGEWHVVVLNSTTQWALCPPREIGSAIPGPATPAEGRACVGDAAQRAWLALDLASHLKRCTLAYFHHPRFSSGPHGNQYEMQQFWDILYAFGVDVVVSAHDHLYERFAPQDPDGNADAERGIRQFTVGTGGAPLYSFATVVPNSEARDDDTHGVLALALGVGEYGWAFVPVAGESFTDYGRDVCR